MFAAMLFGGQAFDISESLDVDIDTCKFTAELACSLGVHKNLLTKDNYDHSNEMQVIYLVYNYLRWLEKNKISENIRYVAGQSVSQLLALHYAAHISTECLIQILIKRTLALSKFVKPNTGMISVIGYSADAFERLCEIISSKNCFISNYHAKNSITVSGENGKLQEICEIIWGSKIALCKNLNVKGGWHSALVELPDDFTFSDTLSINKHQNKVSVIDNSTLQIISSESSEKEINYLLKKNMYSPVRWAETLQEIDNAPEIEHIFFGGGFSMIEKLSKHSLNKTRYSGQK